MADDSLIPSAVTAAPAATNGAPPTGADWRSSLSEDLRGDKTLAQIKGATWEEAGPALAKGYVESQKFAGGAIRLPKDDAKPEEWASFYSKLGRPEKAEGYDLVKPDQIPEGLAWRPEWETKARATAHSLGLTAKQFGGIVNLYNEMRLEEMTGLDQHHTQEKQQAEAELIKAWGPKDSPVYRRNMAAARELVAKVFANDARMAEAVEQAGNNAAFVMGLAKLAALAQEDGLIAGDPVYFHGAEDAKRRIREIRESPTYRQAPEGSTARTAMDDELKVLYQRAGGPAYEKAR